MGWLTDWGLCQHGAGSGYQWQLTRCYCGRLHLWLLSVMERNQLESAAFESMADFLVRPETPSTARIKRVQLRSNHVRSHSGATTCPKIAAPPAHVCAMCCPSHLAPACLPALSWWLMLLLLQGGWRGCLAFARVIRGNSCLTHLDLADNWLGENGPDIAMEITRQVGMDEGGGGRGGGGTQQSGGGLAWHLADHELA